MATATEKRTIPLVDLRQNYELHRKSYERLLTEAAANCDFILGRHVARFEELFAEYLGVRHVVGVASGTDALTLALKALELPPGSRVLTQANTFIATTLAIRNAGCEPVLTDCDTARGAMELASYSGPTPAVVMPVHLYGHPFDVQAIHERFGDDVIVVEDAAQAHGSHLDGRRCGAMGRAAGFSFYPGKNLGAFGDGGAVATDDGALAEEIRSLGNWGGREKYVHDREGGNSRLDNIQAAVLAYKLERLDEWNARRRRSVAVYKELLADQPRLELPPDPPAGGESCWHLFPVLVPPDRRDDILKSLHASGIQAGIHYPVPIHRQKVYADMPLSQGSFPNAEMRAARMISLPLFPELKEKEISYISERLRAAVS